MIGCIIQARMGSTRLPGKVLKKLNDEIPILKFQMNQLKFSNNIDKIIIATTTQDPDIQIVLISVVVSTKWNMSELNS